MPEQRLVLLLVKLAAAASLASLLLRFGKFQRLLTRETRTTAERWWLTLCFTLVFGSGVMARVLTRNAYQAVDLGLEGSLLAGLVGGYLTGFMSGLLLALPAMLNGEYWTMALFTGAGATGALLRDVAPSTEEVWRLTPFFDLSLYRILVKTLDAERALFHGGFFGAILIAEFLRSGIPGIFQPKLLYSILRGWPNPSGWETVTVYVSTIFCVAVPLKIWNISRYESQLETQNKLLIEARMAALMRQINPHFLFNTLNSISSLVRTDPEQARAMIYRLSAILRRLLKQQENLYPLREEMAFLDDYLGIEQVRFGPKLRWEKQIEPGALECLVPSMLLQPIVENSIRHGLGPKVEGGCIRLIARRAGDRLHLQVEDDGVGMTDERLERLFHSGIGVSNVNERLKVLFGDDYRMWVDSQPGHGTVTGFEIPVAAAVLARVG